MSTSSSKRLVPVARPPSEFSLVFFRVKIPSETKWIKPFIQKQPNVSLKQCSRVLVNIAARFDQLCYAARNRDAIKVQLNLASATGAPNFREIAAELTCTAL